MRKRKAIVGDIALLIIVLIVFSIVAIMMYKIASALYANSASTGGAGLNTEALYYGKAATKNMDFAIALLVVFFIIGLGAMAYSLRTSPIILPLFLFLVIALVVLGAWFGNMYLSMFSTTEIATEAQDFVLTTQIFSRLPIILGAAGLLIMAFLYFKPTIPGGGA